MKLVRKNEEFIVIENNGSYHKVALNDIDALIVLLCEAKQVDPAKANKSIGEDLFEDQERTVRVFAPYIESLHRDYGRNKRVMKLTVYEVWDRLRDVADKNKDVNPLEPGNKFFHVPEQVLLGQNTCIIDRVIGVDPSLGGNLTMSILKGRDKARQDMQYTIDLEAMDKGGPIPIEEVGLDLTIDIKRGMKYLGGKQKRKRMLEIKNTPYTGSNKQDVPRPEKGLEFRELFQQRFGKTFAHPSVDTGRKSILDVFLDSRIPRQYSGESYHGSPLRNPHLSGKRISQNQLPYPAPVYRTLRSIYQDKMALIADIRYVATAFPKRFDRNNVLLPVRYTKDIAYFVLEEGCAYDVSSINDIRKSAVKAWEC